MFSKLTSASFLLLVFLPLLSCNTTIKDNCISIDGSSTVIKIENKELTNNYKLLHGKHIETSGLCSYTNDGKFALIAHKSEMSSVIEVFTLEFATGLKMTTDKLDAMNQRLVTIRGQIDTVQKYQNTNSLAIISNISCLTY